MKKSPLKLLLITLLLAMSSSLVACGNTSNGKDNNPAYGRTITGFLGYYYSEGKVLPLDGSGLQIGCPLPTTATRQTEPLIDTSFHCNP